MGVTLAHIKNFFHIQQIDTNKTKLVSVTDFDKLSHAMNKWGSPSNKDKIKQQLQILSETYNDIIPKVAYNKILAFSRLAKLAGEKHRHDFQIDIVGEKNNQVKLSVKNIFSQHLTIFDDPMTELHNVLKIPLMNGSQYLKIESDIEQQQLVEFIKDNVKLTINNEENRGFNIAGATDANQDRLGIGAFSLAIREKLANDDQLLQTFIMAKMKCFDYFIVIATDLVPITLELSSDNNGEIIAKSLKDQLDDARDNVENILSKQLAINSEAFTDYCNYIMNKNV